MIREGYIERMIRQIAQALASVLRRRREGDRAGAREELERAYALLLGAERSFVDFVDTGSLVTLFGPAERLRALACLMRAEGLLLQDAGDAAGAGRRWRQALELFDRVGAETDEEIEAYDDVKGRLGAG